MIFYGTSCTEGEGYGIVTMIGDDTIMGNIAKMASDDGEENPSPINKEIKRFIHIVSAVAIFLGITFCVIGLIMDHSWPAGITSNLVFMIGIIVANVPEGLLRSQELAGAQASSDGSHSFHLSPWPMSCRAIVIPWTTPLGRNVDGLPCLYDESNSWPLSSVPR